MIKLFSILIVICSFLNVLGQDTLQKVKPDGKSFPTNINERNVNKLEKFNGNIVAFDGIIEDIETSRRNTPFYKLKISDNHYLWAVLMFGNEANKVGDKVRVIGYLRPMEPDELEKKYLSGTFIVIAFGLIDFGHANFLFLNEASKQKQEWVDGKIPSSR